MNSLDFLLRFEYTVTQQRTDGLWRVRSAGYWYELDLAAGPELLSFHWHPRALGEIGIPHLYKEGGARVGYQGPVSSHIPTGMVSLADFLEYAIDALGVEPQVANWRSVLAQSRHVMASG